MFKPFQNPHVRGRGGAAFEGGEARRGSLMGGSHELSGIRALTQDARALPPSCHVRTQPEATVCERGSWSSRRQSCGRLGLGHAASRAGGRVLLMSQPPAAGLSSQQPGRTGTCVSTRRGKREITRVTRLQHFNQIITYFFTFNYSSGYCTSCCL